MIVDLNTEKQEVATVCASAPGCLPLELAEDLSVTELITLIKKHDGEEYCEAIYDLIVIHKNTNNRVLRSLTEAKSYSILVANSIATSGRASDALLYHIRANTKSDLLKEHVALALLHNKLNKNEEDKNRKLYQTYAHKEDAHSIAARYIIAAHPKTPLDVLAILAIDSHEHVSKTALERMN